MTQYILKMILLVLIPSCMYAKANVYDCFPFFNELELLQIRLDELDDVVDYFVLVESIETQRGNVKPLYFNENKHLFKKYLSKIIHIKVKERHPEMQMWDREHFQRNCITRGLINCHKDDLIMISDLDEIPRSNIVPCLKKLLQPNFHSKKKSHHKDIAFALEQDIFYFQLNRQTDHGGCWGGSSETTTKWHGTVATTFSTLKQKNPQHFRILRDQLPCINNAGWHFTWMGGKDKIRQKLISVVEGNADGLTVSDRDLDNWIESHSRILPIDSTFPKYVQKNQDYLRSIDFIAD